MDSYSIMEAEARAGLARERATLEDYDPTIMGFVFDGVEWELIEDSLPDEAAALEWARRAAGYGEHVGLYVWSGTR
jgi:hypothetical protein